MSENAFSMSVIYLHFSHCEFSLFFCKLIEFGSKLGLQVEEVIESRNTLMKVVELVGKNSKVKKTKKHKIKIQFKDFDKPARCS